MITWMQRHKKWLIITIWISTIAFIGAGFVGWGQYKYGSKASAVAKVGDVSISMSELQKAYSRLYQQYNKMLQGNFDEEKAKQFGLQKQALQQLIQQALLVNLAKSYDLMVSDIELFHVIKSQKVFYKNGAFDKETYKLILSQNRMTPKEYEKGLRRELLIQKAIKLLPVKASENEAKILDTLLSIADKIDYKILSENMITIKPTEQELKTFWGKQKENFMTDKSYEINFVKQPLVSKKYDDATVTKYYKENKMHFKDAEGKILPLDKAKTAIIQELNAKASKDTALRTYIAFKKGKLNPNIKKETLTISKSNNPLGTAVLQKIQILSLTKPYAKPILVNNTYYIIELVKINPAMPKSYEAAKAEVLPLYIEQKRKEKLLALANSSMDNFVGKTTDFITVSSVNAINGLSKEETGEFLQKLFITHKKKSFIILKDGKIVLYNILEQKLLNNKNSNESDVIARLKSTLFSEGLMKTLQNKYKTEIFIKGL
ncbi:Peptidyl-prolyl cis-trans isomerase PpiD [hydrothermal vent metagenome]|uniref:Peptidyl-prolyl cis-trans isomerase PpiD n=1 Tax=hydrothermal vent metagenome TaxID=652676 RepID=A0A1W1BNA9_9ZZZZ